MADLDVPAFDLPASSQTGIDKVRTRDLYVPLYELRVKDVLRKDGRPDGDVESVSLYSLPTGYKLYVGLDQYRRHMIRREPDFQTSVGQAQLGLLGVFHLYSSRPRNVLVMVKPGQPGLVQADSLDDAELAAISSMDGPDREAAAAECPGEPGSPGANPCWRAVARRLLASHAGAGGEFSPFEQRYLKQRLSAKGYAQYQRAMELPAGNPDKLALLSDWRESVLSLDVKEHTAPTQAAQAPAQKAPPLPAVPTQPAVVPAAATPAKIPTKKHPTPPLKSPAPAPTRAAPPAQPQPAPQPRNLPFRRVLLGCVVIFAVIFVLFRRARGR